MKNTFNDPLHLEQRYENRALTRNPNEIAYYGTDETVKLKRDPETGKVTQDAIYFHYGKQDRKPHVDPNETLKDSPVEMTSEEFDRTVEAIKEINGEQARAREAEQRHFGITSANRVLSYDEQGHALRVEDSLGTNLEDPIPEDSRNDPDEQLYPMLSLKRSVASQYDGEQVIKDANLTDVQRRRWYAYNMEGKKQKEIAEEEGAVQKSVSESIRSASAKIAKSLEAYHTGVDAEIRQMARDACDGCVYYNRATGMCQKNPKINADGSPEFTNIYDAVEDGGGRVRRENGRAQIYGLKCYTEPIQFTPSVEDLAIVDPARLNNPKNYANALVEQSAVMVEDLMGIHRRDDTYKPPKKTPKHSAEYMEEHRRIEAESKANNEDLMATLRRWQKDIPAPATPYKPEPEIVLNSNGTWGNIEARVNKAIDRDERIAKRLGLGYGDYLPDTVDPADFENPENEEEPKEPKDKASW